MAHTIGSRVTDPRTDDDPPREGTVLAVERNPACLMRTLVVQWDDGEVEELEEIVFGPLED